MRTHTGPVLLDRSGNTYPLTDRRWRGDDGTPLALSPLPGLTPEQIGHSERSLWRYQPVLPVDPEHRVTLGEGLTPMVPLIWVSTACTSSSSGSTPPARSRIAACR